MSRYASYGSLDNRIDKDGDVGFVGFNNRLRPDQLEAGMLADAQNIRMDRNGQAQVRKGIDLVTTPLAVGDGALVIPFTLVPDDSAVAMAVTNNAIVITNLDAANYAATGTVNISGVTGSLNPTVNGDRTYVKNIDTQITIADQSYSGTLDASSAVVKYSIINNDAVNDIYASCAYSDPKTDASQFIIFASTAKAVGIDILNRVSFDIGYPEGFAVTESAEMTQAFNKVFVFRNGSTAFENDLRIARITAGSLDTNVVTITTSTNHNLVVGDKITISNLTGTDIDPNPNGIFTVTGLGAADGSNTAKKFRYALLNGNNATYTVTSNPIVASNFSVVASGTYTQPLRFDLSNIDLSTGIGTATADSTPVSTLKQGDILTFVSTAVNTTRDEQTLTINITSLPGNAKQSHYKTGRLGGVVYQDPVDTLTSGQNSFNITAVDYDRDVFFRFNKGDIGFDSLVYNGEELNPSGAATTVATSGLFGTSGPEVGVNYPFSLGVSIRGEVNQSGTSGYLIGETIRVKEVTNATTFTFITDRPNRSGLIARVQKPVSVGLGFTHMPAPPFAAYHQRRLVMPFQFTVDSAVNSFTNRNILDEVIISDVLDTDTYDQIYSQYRFNAGTSDFVVGLHSFAEDKILVFNRNSIHIIANTTDLKESTTQVLTDEVGCVARNSIKQVGNQVIFLSDNGVYGTQFLDEYNLRGTETPLSAPISSTIERINRNAQEKSVAVYFDNRYYLAVPIDGSNQNNAVLIYNFLNKQWESVDTAENGSFFISNMFVVGKGTSRGVYVSNELGGIHRLDARSDNVDVTITQIGGTQQSKQIPASITSRQYTFKSLDRKKWRDFDFHVQSSDRNVSDFDIVAETENPDSINPLGKLSEYNVPKEPDETSTDGKLDIGEDVSLRGRIGNLRGYGIQFTFNNTVGRPIIRAIEVEGSTTMRSTNKAI